MSEIVEFGLMEIDYTIDEYDDERKTRPIVHLFGRTDDGTFEHVKVHGYRPYFYANESQLDLAAYEALDSPGVIDFDSEATHESIRGTDLIRVTCNTPRTVRDVSDSFVHYEADIRFTNRFLVDKSITNGVRVTFNESARDGDNAINVPHSVVEPCSTDATPRVFTYDIEVDDRNGFPEDGDEEIISIVGHDSVEQTHIVWLYLSDECDDVGTPSYEPIADEFDHEIRTFDSEVGMLEDVLDYIDSTDADYQTGWNVEDFDTAYLIDRLDVLDSEDNDIDSNRLGRVGEVYNSNSSWYGPTVKGRGVFDLLYAYKRMVISELDSYRLDAVAEEELGVGKERYKGAIGDLWENDPTRLVEYNLRDVELCVELNGQLDIIPFWREVATFVGCSLEDAPTPGSVVDQYVIRESDGRFVLPSKAHQSGDEFEGANVFEPSTGISDNVVALDLRSLYPMSMVTINASPETKVDPDEYDGETHVAPNGVHFRQEPDGFFRQMVFDLLEERQEKKDRRDEHDHDSVEYEKYDRQQGAVKVIMNTLYGVSGSQDFRLYDTDAAGAITATGRDVIEFTETCVEELDYEVEYGDTDSVLVELGDDVDHDEACKTGYRIEQYINDRYDDFALEQLNADEHWFELEFEKLYRRFLQAGKKKRYAGHITYKDHKEVDDIDITGYEYKRSDVAPITKRVQYDVIEMIVREGDLDAMESYVRDEVEKTKRGDQQIEDVAMPGGIGKPLYEYDIDTKAVRGAKYANLLLGTQFNNGSKPKHLPLANVENSFFAALEDADEFDRYDDPMFDEFVQNPELVSIEYADELPPEFVIDWDVVAEYTLERPIGRVFVALDKSLEEVLANERQTGLSAFA